MFSFLYCELLCICYIYVNWGLVEWGSCRWGSLANEPHPIELL